MNDLLAVPPPAPARPVPGARPRILYVDDDPELREISELVLVHSGFDVDGVADGAQAWAALQHHDYQLLITDQQMPHLTGLELIRKVRAARLTVPIILASGALGALPVDVLPWSECGALLAKPFTPEQLVSVVQEVLRAAASKSHPPVPPPVMGPLYLPSEPNQDWGINE